MSTYKPLLRAVINAEFDRVNAGMNGNTSAQIMTGNVLSAARHLLAADMGVSPVCDLFNAAIESQRSKHEQWIAGLCYGK